MRRAKGDLTVNRRLVGTFVHVPIRPTMPQAPHPDASVLPVFLFGGVPTTIDGMRCERRVRLDDGVSPKFDCFVTGSALASEMQTVLLFPAAEPAGPVNQAQAGRMYQATEHLPTDAERSDDVNWYVRKFRLENSEDDARSDSLPLEVPEVRSRKWLFVVIAVVIGLSALLALASFAVAELQ